MNEQRPAIGANEKGDWNGSAMRCQERGKLAVEHRIEQTAAIELGSTFTQTQDWRFAAKRHRAISAFLKAQFLHEFAVGAANGNREWLRLDLNKEMAGTEFSRARQITGPKYFGRGERDNNSGWRPDIRVSLAIQRGEFDSQRSFADLADD